MKIQEPFSIDSSDSEEEAIRRQKEIAAQFPDDVPEVYGPEADDEGEDELERYQYYYDENEIPEDNYDEPEESPRVNIYENGFETHRKMLNADMDNELHDDGKDTLEEQYKKITK